MIHKIKHQGGNTLFEFVIVIILLSIIVVGSGELIRYGFIAYLNGTNNIDTDMQGRIILERMTRDLHTIRSSADITYAASNTITFTDIDGNSVQYQLNGTQLKRNTQVLADNIQNLTFNYYNSNGNDITGGSILNIRYITIAITINNGSNFNFKTGVVLWNLI